MILMMMMMIIMMMMMMMMMMMWDILGVDPTASNDIKSEIHKLTSMRAVDQASPSAGSTGCSVFSDLSQHVQPFIADPFLAI